MTSKKLIITAGAAGEIGAEFCRKAVENQIDCIGIIRNKKTGIQSAYFQELTCNLDNEKEIEQKLSDINFENYDQVIYLHTIGVDKFDPRGYPNIKPMDTIDPEVYNTNVNSFKYLLKFCLQKINEINSHSKNKKVRFRIVLLAGVGDKFTPFVIESFCEAKFIIRQYTQSYVNLYPEWVSGLSINISSTITQSALRVRPHADTEFWLTPKEVVNKSFDELISDTKLYKEIDIYKSSPFYTEGYYENNPLLYSRWSKETGISSSKELLTYEKS